MIRVGICLIAVLAVPASHAMACSCAELPPPLESLKSATAVFSGRILSAKPEGANGYAYTVEVYAVWKGPASPELIVTTSDVGMCGLWMGVGSEFLVYALGDEGALTTHNCTRSKPLQFAGADLAELGTPVAVATGALTLSVLKARYE